MSRIKSLVEHEPGELIKKTHCPCCGASLSIEYGDDDGEICVIGTPIDYGYTMNEPIADACGGGEYKDDEGNSTVIKLKM